MRNEQFKWNSVTCYIDTETGEQIDKTEIGVNYTKIGLIDTNVRYNNEKCIKTVIRTVGLTKIAHKQLTLWK